MTKKIVIKVPIGSNREDIKKAIKILNEEYGNKLVCTVDDRKVLTFEYRDLTDGDILSVGIFLGREIKVSTVN